MNGEVFRKVLGGLLLDPQAYYEHMSLAAQVTATAQSSAGLDREARDAFGVGVAECRLTPVQRAALAATLLAVVEEEQSPPSWALTILKILGDARALARVARLLEQRLARTGDWRTVNAEMLVSSYLSGFVGDERHALAVSIWNKLRSSEERDLRDLVTWPRVQC